MALPPVPVRFQQHHDIGPGEAPGYAGGYEPGDVVGLPPDPAAAAAAAGAVIAALGTGAMNPQAAATLAAEAPAHCAAGKAAP